MVSPPQKNWNFKVDTDKRLLVTTYDDGTCIHHQANALTSFFSIQVPSLSRDSEMEPKLGIFSGTERGGKCSFLRSLVLSFQL
jgi:hypothetical protein